MRWSTAILVAVVIGTLGFTSANAASRHHLTPAAAEVACDRTLAAHPHLEAWYDDHELSAPWFVRIVHRYPDRMHGLIASPRYDHWLFRFIRGRDGNPPVDLLLGS